MAREISTPPKERINITYKSAGEGKEEIELPFRLMMVGDYTLQTDKTPLKERELVEIRNKEDFTKALKKHELGLTFPVKNTLSDEAIENDDELEIELKFENMTDFRPDSIAEQVPELKELLQIREALKALRAPLGSEYDFRKAIDHLLESDDLDQLLNSLTD